MCLVVCRVQAATRPRRFQRRCCTRNPSLSVPPWPSISDQAKHLVQWMLQPDPSKRPTAHEVLWTSPLPPVHPTPLLCS